MPTKKRDSEAQTPWTRRIIRMRQYQEENSKNWKRNEKLIFGEQMDGSLPGLESSMQDSSNEIAYGWGLYKSLETQIYVSNPDCFVESYDPALKDTAKRLTSIVQWDMDLMDIKGTGNLLLQDCFIAGYGAVIESLENDKTEIEHEDGEKDVSLNGQEYNLRRIHYWDILFDPQGKKPDLSDHRYIAIAFYPTISELKSDPMYTDLPDDIEEFPEASETSRRDNKPGRFRSSARSTTAEDDPDYKRIAIWEVWDKITDKVLYITDNGYHQIGSIDWPVKLKIGCRRFFPVTLFYMHPQPNQFYPKAEIDLISRQLVELNQLEAVLREDSLTKWRKYLIADNVVGEDQKARFVDPSSKNWLMTVPMSGIEELVGGPQNMSGFDLNKLVVKLEDASPPRDLPVRKALIEQDIQHIIGYGPGERGGMPSTRSAREAVMLYERQNQKVAKRMDMVNDFYRAVTSKHVQFLQQTMEIARYARIVGGKPGMNEFFQYAKSEIQGDFTFDVIPGSSGAKNTDSKRAQAMQEFQALAPIVQQEGFSVRPLVEYVADYMGWKSVDLIWMSQKKAAAELAQALLAFDSGQIQAEQLLESASKMVMTELTQGEMKQIVDQMKGQMQQAQQPQQPQGQRGDTNPMGTTAGTM